MVSGTRRHEKRGHASFSIFLLVFFDRFRASLVSTLLEVFMTDNLENRILPVLGKGASLGAFLRHVAETPIKLVKRGNGNRCCFGYVPETPIKLVKKGGNGNGRNRRQHRESIKNKREPSRGTPIRRKIRIRRRRRRRERRSRRRRRRRRLRRKGRRREI